MFRRKKREQHEILLRARIKELENLLCPAEQHDFVAVNTRFQTAGIGDVQMIKRWVCRRCLLTKEEASTG